MSIYDDSVFLLYPSGYKAGTIYSVKPNTSLGDGTMTRNSTKVRVNSDSYLETMAVDVLAPDYAGGGCPVFRTDEQRTNLITYYSLDNVYWTKSGATIDDNGGLGYSTPLLDAGVPTTEAYKLVEDGTTGAHRITRALTGSPADATVTLSIIAKAAERNWILLYESVSNSGYYFDLTNGVVGDRVGTAPENYSITPLADGYYSISITSTYAGTVSSFYLYLSDGNKTTLPTYTGDGTSGVYLCYPQLEEGSYASPLMLPATEGSTTTRLADAVTGFGDAATFASLNANGAMIIRMAAHADDLTDRYYSISDGTTDNAVQIYYSSTTNQIAGSLILGGVAQCLITATLTDETDFSNVGFYWDTDDFALYADGAEVGTADTSGDTFGASVLTEFAFDDGAGTNAAYTETGYVMIGNYTKAQIITQTT